MKRCTDPDAGKLLLVYDSLEGPDAAVLELHLRGCARCRAEMEEYKSAAAALREELAAHPSAEELFDFGSAYAAGLPPEGSRRVRAHLLVCRACDERVEALRAADRWLGENPGRVADADLSAASDDAKPRGLVRTDARAEVARAAGAEPRRDGAVRFGSAFSPALFGKKIFAGAVAAALALAAVGVVAWRNGLRDAYVRTSMSVIAPVSPGALRLTAPEDGASAGVGQQFVWHPAGAHAAYRLTVRDASSHAVVLEKEVSEATYRLSVEDARGLTADGLYEWSVSGRLGDSEWQSPPRRFTFVRRPGAL